MKKFLSVLLVAVSTFGASKVEAQAPTQVKTFTAVTIRNAGDSIRVADTLKNTDANTIGHRVSYNYATLFRVKYTRVSGYMRVTSKLKGAYDSVNGPWYTLRGDKTICASCVDSTFTTTDAATNYATWYMPRSPFTYLKLFNTSDTTQNTVVTMSTDYKY